MKASITMEETTEFAVHAGMFPTSMKVFRISGRDTPEPDSCNHVSPSPQ